MWITIDDRDEGGVLSVEASRLLSLIGGDLGCQWSVLEMEARAESFVLGRSVLELEQEAFNSERGLLLSWDNLIELARSVTEFIDVTIVGCRTVGDIPRTLDEKSLEGCEVVLQLIDSDIWRASLRDQDLVRRFMSAFPRARVE